MFSKSEINNKYFEERNFNRLMERLFNYFNKSYNYKVGKDEEVLCRLVMKSMYQHINPENKETRVNYIKRLNRQSLNEIIKIVKSKMNEINNTPDIVRNDINIIEGNSRQNTIANFPGPKIPVNNEEISKNFEKISKERDINSNKRLPVEIPKFQMITEEDNQDITKAFEEVQKNFEEDRKKYEASQKIEKDNLGNDIFLDKPINSEPSASNIDNSQDLIIRDESKIINSKDFEKNELIIPQPKQYAKVLQDTYNTLTKDYYIVIDSRDRNYDIYPNPNNYQVEFDNVLRAVTSIELISAEIPAVQYNINSNNNILHIDETGTTLQAEIEIGQYDDIDDLRAAIQTALNTVSSNYTVTVSTITRKFTITNGSTNFELLFEGDSEVFVQGQTRTKYLENSIGPIIGFSRTDLSGAATYTGDNQYNLSGENYVLLYIKELENLESVSGNSTIHDTFTKINLDSETSNVKFYRHMDEYISRVSFTPPMASIGQMIIKFYNYDGSLYDFSGRDHSLYFKITTFNQATEYYQG